MAGSRLRVSPHALEVGQRPAWRHQRGDAIVGKLAIGAMRDRADDQVVGPAIRLGELDAMVAFDLLGRRDRVGGLDLVAQPLQPLDHIEAAAVPEVRHILLEGQPEDQRPARLAPAVVERVGDPRAHPVVGLPAGEDHLRVVPDPLRQVAEVIRIDADAVAADQPRLEGQEVPLGPRRVEHVPHRNADLREDLGHFVDERDVDVALRILDRLGRLGRLDRGGPEHAPAGHRAIEPGELLDHLLILAGDDLGDLVDTVLAVARVDPLGTVAEPEVAAPLEAADLLDPRAAQILGHARVDRALVNDRRPPAGVEPGRQHLGRRQHRPKVGPVALIDRRRNGDDIDVRTGAIRRIRRQLQPARPKLRRIDFTGPVAARPKLGDPALVNVEPNRLEPLRQRHRQRQTHIPKTNHNNPRRKLHQTLIITRPSSDTRPSGANIIS